MKLFYEIVMGAAFTIPILVMLTQMVHKEMDAQRVGECSFFSAACSLGFLFGTIARWLAGEQWIVPLLYAIGFFSSCVTFIYTLYLRRKPHERQ